MRPAEQVLLLLSCRLGQEVQPLRPAEYRQLAAALQASAIPVEDELTESMLRSLGFSPDFAARVFSLLEREDALQRYLSAAPDVTVLTSLSGEFPRRLCRLGRDCPPVLFCKGDRSLFASRCISLVGSRKLLPRGAAFAQRIGQLAAREGWTLVSGNAPGADRFAQEACLAAGGRVISFVADKLSACRTRENMLFCCDEGYELPFTATRALRRNGQIHALGERTFIAQCPFCRGGTWTGTADNLRRGLSDVCVLNDGTEGVRALIDRGAVPVDDFLASLAELPPSQLSIFN